ncbi:MAG: response regulator [Colwellia sp.]|nr:response regulator [Colwellia sp.]
MTIKHKLLVGFFLVFILTTLEAFWVYSQLQTMAEPLEKNIPASIDELNRATDLNNQARLIRYYDEILTQSARNYALTQEKRWLQRYYAFEPELDLALKQAIAIGAPQDKQIFEDISQANINLIAMEYKAIKLVNDGKPTDAIQLMISGNYALQKDIYGDGLNTYFLQRQAGHAQSIESATVTVRLAAQNAHEILQETLQQAIFLILLILAILIIIAVFITFRISKPLQKLTEYALKISHGDLTQKVSVSSHDEIGILANAFQTMSNALKKSYDNLEDKISRRTHELESKNIELKNIIVERKTLEHQLLQSQKMESLGTLAGGIAHDFNNILTAILSNAEIGLLKLSDDNSVRRYFESITVSGERAAFLVKQILTFSRMETTELETLDLSKIILEDLKMVRSVIPSNIEIKKDIQMGCLPIMADRTQLHQILLNVCTNAYHAITHESGTIEISLQQPKELPDYFHDKNKPFLRLKIKDSGCGMSPDIQKNIFDPFYTTKQQGHGTGLGLSVVHGLVKKHHGKIFVDSEEGKGTTFTIYFPAVDAVVIEIKPPVSHRKKGTGSILIAEDEIEIAALYQEYLEGLNYTIKVCHNGADALSIFKQAPDKYDLVLTDYAMPKMTGSQLIQELHKIRPELPVILCSGYNDSLELSELNINKCLKKPLNLAQLQDAINQSL